MNPYLDNNKTRKNSSFYQPFLQDAVTFYTLDEFSERSVWNFTRQNNQIFAWIVAPGSSPLSNQLEIEALTYQPEFDRWVKPDASRCMRQIVMQQLVPQAERREIIVHPRLPVSDVRIQGWDAAGTPWVGTMRGLCRRDKRQTEWRYYAGRRWLPDDRVTCLLIEDGSTWIGTESGISWMRRIPMTLEQKAEHYEQITAARHNRRGFVATCRLADPTDLSNSLHEATDNDGLWTALAVCAWSFRYAVTGDAEAKSLAAQSVRALLELVRVTGIPGFPARALIRKGENVLQSDPGPNWYPSPASPDILYKNDTSSDEIDGHYLAWYVFAELAADAGERQAIVETCRAVTNHILDNDYTLVGPTGKPTRWGIWSPAKLNDDPEWFGERGLNSLSILSHLKVAIHLCGDARFQEAYRTLIDRHGYAQNTLDQKIVPPRGEDNHSDDELAACAYYPLLQLETEPGLRAVYLESLHRTHAIIRRKRSPFYNVLFAACTGGDWEPYVCLPWFQQTPLDLRDWRMINSHRDDVEFDPEPGRFGERQLTRVLSPAECRVTRWNSNPFEADTGTDGTAEEDGIFWLLPYWMARYHGLPDRDTS